MCAPGSADLTANSCARRPGGSWSKSSWQGMPKKALHGVAPFWPLGEFSGALLCRLSGGSTCGCQSCTGLSLQHQQRMGAETGTKTWYTDVQLLFPQALYFFSQDDGAEMCEAKLNSRPREAHGFAMFRTWGPRMRLDRRRPDFRGQEELIELQLVSQAERAISGAAYVQKKCSSRACLNLFFASRAAALLELSLRYFIGSAGSAFSAAVRRHRS